MLGGAALQHLCRGWTWGWTWVMLCSLAGLLDRYVRSWLKSLSYVQSFVWLTCAHGCMMRCRHVVFSVLPAGLLYVSSAASAAGARAQPGHLSLQLLCQL